MPEPEATEGDTGPYRLPDPEERPTVPVWPDAGWALGTSRGATYDAVARGEIPSIRIGRRVVVPTAALRRLLGLDS
jgi:excisionase family DNA binding protein